MDRRTFIECIALGLAVAPFAVRAQQANNSVRIGFLPLGSPSNAYDLSLVGAFRQGLQEVGLAENRDFVLDIVWIGSEAEIPQAVSQLMRRGAKLLIPVGTSASTVVKRHVATDPIVFINVGNPVGIGLVDSLSRPGHNVTGFSDMLADLSGKFVELVIQLGEPRPTINYLWYTEWADGQYRFEVSERTAQSNGVKFRPRGIRDIAEANDAVAAMKAEGATTVIVQTSPFTYRHRVQLINVAMSYGIGTVSGFATAASDGALIAYGPNYFDMYRRAASYIERILKGANPADLPVQQPTKFDFIVNLKTAKTLGVTVPNSMLVRADEVIR